MSHNLNTFPIYGGRPTVHLHKVRFNKISIHFFYTEEDAVCHE
ncbi:hypothetical protein HMPREF1548_05657 [Clostridium sp. KLE 1755]|nr:hypothetical protein HMPREF1548_05657 [Clostridium sp. KLE 1755]